MSSRLIRDLYDGEAVTIKGQFVRWNGKTGDNLISGDYYVAERNQHPKLLICERVDPRRWVVATTSNVPPYDYPYDTWECLGVDILSN